MTVTRWPLPVNSPRRSSTVMCACPPPTITRCLAMCLLSCNEIQGYRAMLLSYPAISRMQAGNAWNGRRRQTP